MKHLIAVMVVSALVLAVQDACAEGIRVPLTMREWSGLARRGEPVTTGIPLDPGAVSDLTRLAVFDDGGERVPAQFASLARGPDGSARGLVCDFPASVVA